MSRDVLSSSFPLSYNGPESKTLQKGRNPPPRVGHKIPAVLSQSVFGM